MDTTKLVRDFKPAIMCETQSFGPAIDVSRLRDYNKAEQLAIVATLLEDEAACAAELLRNLVAMVIPADPGVMVSVIDAKTSHMIVQNRALITQSLARVRDALRVVRDHVQVTPDEVKAASKHLRKTQGGFTQGFVVET